MGMIAGLLAALLAQAAQVPPPPPLHGGPAEMVCPIGGEKFEALATSHYSTRGQRPDGRPYTYWHMPLPIPECPSNGLVLFDDFDKAELVKLVDLIATPEYRALRRDDTSYYRAQWLATRIGRPETEALWLLLPATWQVKPARGLVGQGAPSPEKARAYQREFVRRVLALPERPDDREFHALYFRAANAEREMGRFRQARAMLNRLEGWLARGDPGEWRTPAARLRPVVDRRDASVEPLDMIGDEAVYVCAERPPRSSFDRAFCARPDIASEVAEHREVRAGLRSQ